MNIAARLEGLAEPGGICISRMVRDNIRDKLDYTFEDLGEQQVKNIARPVRVYALRPEAVADLPATMVPHAASISEPAESSGPPQGWYGRRQAAVPMMPNPAALHSDPVTRPRSPRPVLVAIPGANG